MIAKNRAPNPGKRVTVVALVAAALLLGGCHRPKKYESTVEITRLSVVRQDETGAPTTTDVEFSYVECPGTQTEVVRGGKDFATCVGQKLKVGSRAKVKVLHRWDPEGFYNYDVFEVEGCPRPPDPNDEASYKIVRECADWTVNGSKVGFQCNYQNKKDVNKACPWFKSH